MAICGIYKIENLINHKVYIGQTIDIKTRWFHHKTATDNFIIHKAFKKYGLDNFSFNILEECSKDELNNKEIYYINKYNSLVPNGYNMIEGGSNGAALAKRKKVNQYSLNGEYIQTFESISEASRQTNISDANIVSCCKHKRNYAGDFQWRYPDDNDKDIQCFEKIFKTKKKNVIIQQIDLNNEQILNEYPTLTAAAEDTKISVGNISSCCQGKRRSAGGYKWNKLIKEEKNSIIIKKRRENKNEEND